MTKKSTEKIDKKSYILLIKRTNKPLTQELINKIIKRELGKKSGIEITNSFYMHGSYDWVIFFNAPDIIAAKGFVEVTNKIFEGGSFESQRQAHQEWRRICEMSFPL